jgi:hypothetical protein
MSKDKGNKSISQAPAPLNLPKPYTPIKQTYGYLYKRPDYDNWAEKDLWLLGEAVCLISGVEPIDIKYEHNCPLYSKEFVDEDSVKLRDTLDMALRAIGAGRLAATAGDSIHTWEVNPAEFVTWAYSKKHSLTIPDELQGLIEEEGKCAMEKPTHIDSMLKELQPEIESLYLEIKKTKDTIAGADKIWEKAVLEKFTEEAEHFKIVKRHHLEYNNIYALSGTNIKRDFVGRLLQHILQSDYIDPPGVKSLYRKYINILK